MVNIFPREALISAIIGIIVASTTDALLLVGWYFNTIWDIGPANYRGYVENWILAFWSIAALAAMPFMVWRLYKDADGTTAPFIIPNTIVKRIAWFALVSPVLGALLIACVLTFIASTGCVYSTFEANEYTPVRPWQAPQVEE